MVRKKFRMRTLSCVDEQGCICVQYVVLYFFFKCYNFFPLFFSLNKCTFKVCIAGFLKKERNFTFKTHTHAHITISLANAIYEGVLGFDADIKCFYICIESFIKGIRTYVHTCIALATVTHHSFGIQLLDSPINFMSCVFSTLSIIIIKSIVSDSFARIPV